jgi:hypothetical protein
MVTMSATAATNVSFRARTTTVATLDVEGTAMSAVRQDDLARLTGAPAFGNCFDATRVAIKVQPSVAPAHLGHRAWSPPS